MFSGSTTKRWRVIKNVILFMMSRSVFMSSTPGRPERGRLQVVLFIFISFSIDLFFLCLLLLLSSDSRLQCWLLSASKLLLRSTARQSEEYGPPECGSIAIGRKVMYAGGKSSFREPTRDEWPVP